MTWYGPGEDCRGDLMRARHRLSELLLRHGIVYYGGHACTGRQDIWLRQDAAPQLITLATRLTFHSTARRFWPSGRAATDSTSRSLSWPPSPSSPR